MDNLFKPKWLNRDDFRKMYPDVASCEEKWQDLDKKLRRAEIIVDSIVGCSDYAKTEKVLLAGYMVTKNIIYFSDPKIELDRNSGYTSVQMPDVKWTREDSYYSSNPLITQEILDLLEEAIACCGGSIETVKLRVSGDNGYVYYDGDSVDYAKEDSCCP